MKAKDVVQKWRKSFSCTLLESIMSSEIESSLQDWVRNTNNDDYVLIGGLVVGYYTRPRMTDDIDALFLSDSDIPEEVLGFRKHRKHAFEHEKHGVEIETLTPEFINQNATLVQKVFETSVVRDGARIADPEGLIALKIKRHSFQDIADIDAIMNVHEVNLRDWPLDEADVEFVEDKLGYKIRNTKDEN